MSSTLESCCITYSANAMETSTYLFVFMLYLDELYVIVIDIIFLVVLV